MNFALLFLKLITGLPQVLQLIVSIVGEVHTIQTATGLSGAEKSQNVIDKVTPIADTIGVEAPHIQSIINDVVNVSKQFGIGTFAPGATIGSNVPPAAPDAGG